QPRHRSFADYRRSRLRAHATRDRRTGVMANIDLLIEEINSAKPTLLHELRFSKTVDRTAMSRIIGATDGLVHAFAGADAVPRVLIGDLLYIFTQMLTEAEHSRAPELILDEAWEYWEHLRKMFVNSDRR